MNLRLCGGAPAAEYTLGTADGHAAVDLNDAEGSLHGTDVLDGRRRRGDPAHQHGSKRLPLSARLKRAPTIPSASSAAQKRLSLSLYSASITGLPAAR